MPKKKSVRLCAQDFSRKADELLEYCQSAGKTLTAAHVSLVYDGAVLKLYAAFEQMMMGALTGAINNDTSQLSTTANIQFPKHLTDEVCEYIIIGNGYFNFKGRDGLIGEIGKYVPNNHYLLEVIRGRQYKMSLDQLCALRNYAAHSSMASKKIALKSTGQERIGSAGSWLKRQERFPTLVNDLKRLSREIEQKAPY